MKWAQLVKGANLVQNNNVDQTNHVVVTNMVYAAGVKTLTFYLTIRGSNRRTFGGIITFLRVEEIDVESEEEAIEALSNRENMMVEDSEGHKHIVEKPNLMYNDVQCRCSCESFRFSFAYADRMNRSMAGANFPAYHRKTPLPPLGRPRRNPDHIPGVDKHLITAMDVLVREGLVI